MSYAAVFDSSAHHYTSYLDTGLQVFRHGYIKHIHSLVFPIFERHKGDYYICELFENLSSNVLDPHMKEKLIGVNTDGAASMTGHHQGVILTQI